MPRSEDSETGIALPVESVAVLAKSGAASPMAGNAGAAGAAADPLRHLGGDNACREDAGKKCTTNGCTHDYLMKWKTMCRRIADLD